MNANIVIVTIFSFGLMIGMYIIAQLARLIMSPESDTVVTILAALAIAVAGVCCYTIVVTGIGLHHALTDMEAFLRQLRLGGF